MTRTIMHIDVNSAFLSWTAVHMLQHGSSIDLRNIPSIIGGNQATRHGIVLAKSIPAKGFKIQTGEPVFQAKQKCPNLVVMPPDYFLYMQCSSALSEILQNYSDKIQLFSIDECFLDYTGIEKILGEPIKVANQIREQIRKELGFTVNIGISTNKLLAKMAGDLKKPDMTHTIYPEEISAKMWPLPVEDLYMVGRATAPKLKGMGIHTIGDLANTDIELLKYKFKSWGLMLHAYANGIDESPVHPGSGHTVIKGIGNSTTVYFDVIDKQTAYKVLLSLVETVSMRLRFSGFCCSVVAVSLKTDELISSSHQKKLMTPIDCTNAVFKEVKSLFDEMWRGQPIRQMGIRVSDLYTKDYIQLSFFEENWDKQRRLDKTIDEIRIKYGSNAVIRSSFLWSGLSPLEGGVVDEFPVMSSIL